MRVATKSKKASPLSLLVEPLVLKADNLALPKCHIAVVPTAAGDCGISWRTVSDPLAGPAAFAERTARGTTPVALLRHIVTPGLSSVALRKRLLDLAPGCAETFADRAGRFHPSTVPQWFGELAGFLQHYYSDAFRCPIVAWHEDVWAYWQPHLDLSHIPPFTLRVLRLVASIPSGEVWTYGRIAKALNKPNAARAVGAALASNPWPVLVPCHRVVGANGAMTGFSAPGGVSTKRDMLARENANLFSVKFD